MLHFTKLLICPFRSSSAGTRVIPAQAGIQSANCRNCEVYGLDSCPLAITEQAFRGNDLGITDSGYALLFVMVVATILLISLTAALPSIYQEGQREREQELIFRGIQYARAIASFHQKFQRYPTSIQELTKQTNGLRFLRKEYTDPMTPNGKWRYIHANAQGALLDSKTQGPAPGSQNQPSSGQGAGEFGASATSGMGGSSFAQQGMGGSSFGQQGMGGSSFGQQGMGGSSFGQQGTGGSSFGQQGTGGSEFGQSTGGFSSDSNPAGGLSNTQQSSGFGTPGGSQGGGTFIVGVASTSHKASIRTWNQKTRYDEWEFIGVDLGALGITTSIPGLPQGVSGQPNQGNQPGGFGQPNQGNQFGGFGQSNQGNQPSGFGQPGQGNPQSGQTQDGFQSSSGSSSSPQ